MAESIPQIRSDIENTKVLISQTVEQIENRFEEIRDVKRATRQYPLASLGIAIGAGFILSRGLGPLLRLSRSIGGRVLSATLSAFFLQQLRRRF